MQYFNEESFDHSQNLSSNERLIPGIGTDRSKVLYPILVGNKMTKEEIVQRTGCLGAQSRISELINQYHWPIVSDPINFTRSDGKEVTISKYYIPSEVLKQLHQQEDVKGFIEAGKQRLY